MLRVLLLATLLISSAGAHVPTFAEAGSSPETAFLVDEPDQSRVFYGELSEAQQHWFRFERETGDAMDVSVHLPSTEAARPTLWIVGPGIAGDGPPQTPAGLGGQRAPLQDDLSVEPFTPLAMRAVSEWSQPAPESGTYYVVVEAQAPVTYSVAIGRGESFTLFEWVVIPAQRISIVSWAGLPGLLAVAGETLAVVAIIALGWRGRWSVQQRIGLAAAAAMAGSALTTLALALIASVQGGFNGAIAVPMIFAAIAMALGAGAFQAVRQGRSWAALAYGVGGLAFWAGLIVGPAALVAWAIWRLVWRKSVRESPVDPGLSNPPGR